MYSLRDLSSVGGLGGARDIVAAEGEVLFSRAMDWSSVHARRQFVMTDVHAFEYVRSMTPGNELEDRKYFCEVVRSSAQPCTA